MLGTMMWMILVRRTRARRTRRRKNQAIFCTFSIPFVPFLRVQIVMTKTGQDPTPAIVKRTRMICLFSNKLQELKLFSNKPDLGDQHLLTSNDRMHIQDSIAFL